MAVLAKFLRPGDMRKFIRGSLLTVTKIYGLRPRIKNAFRLNRIFRRCHCPTGFEGGRCEVNIDDCDGNKCSNSAVCVDGINSYSCTCPPGFMGEYCERKISFCSKEFNPCKNSATCVDHGTGYECQCALGWSGNNCTENLDDCANHMCQVCRF